MPWLVGALVRAAGWLWKSRIGLFIGSLFAWAGINFATVKVVIEPAMNAVEGYTKGTMGGGAGQYWQVAMDWMGVLHFDQALTMLLSAVAVKHGLMQGRLFLFKRGIGA